MQALKLHIQIMNECVKLIMMSVVVMSESTQLTGCTVLHFSSGARETSGVKSIKFTKTNWIKLFYSSAFQCQYFYYTAAVLGPCIADRNVTLHKPLVSAGQEDRHRAETQTQQRLPFKMEDKQTI